MRATLLLRVVCCVDSVIVSAFFVMFAVTRAPWSFVENGEVIRSVPIAGFTVNHIITILCVPIFGGIIIARDADVRLACLGFARKVLRVTNKTNATPM